ncbi:MAG: response regulator transcription factor [Gemmatimonadota bacterium]|nr:response regulator transcription factor [Gemmatimonadota bacterium]
MSRPRLIIADDHHLMVEALRTALSADYDVVAVAYDADEVLEKVASIDADCLLLDLSLPGQNGLELLPHVQRLAPELPVIVVTMHLDRAVADTAMQGGARGFVPKDSGLEELEEAIATVLAGGLHVSPRLPPNSNRTALRAAHAGLAQLTPRQHEIVRLIAEGRTSPEIAKWLGLSQRTIAFHRTNIREKLGIDSERGLLRFALLTRMSDDGEDGEA